MAQPAVQKRMGSTFAIFYSCTLFTTAFGSLPFLFPSPHDTKGDVYNNVTGRLVPVDSIFPDCFCVDYSDPEQIPPPDSVMGSVRPCGVFVLYTTLPNASFTFMDIGFDGAVTSKKRNPQYKVEVFDDDGTANVTVRTRNLELANRLSNDKEGFSDGINFVLSNLPRDKTVLFEVADSRGAARRFYISRYRRKAKPVEGEIQQDRINWIDNVKVVRFRFDSMVIPTRTPEELELLRSCREDLDPHFVQRPSDGQILINPGVWSVNCPTVIPDNYSTEDLQEMILVDGATNYTITFSFLPFDPVTLLRPVVTVRIFLNEGVTEGEIKVSFLDGGAESIDDGDPLAQSQTFRIKQFSRDSVLRVQTLAQSLGIMAGVGVGAAVATSIGSAVVSSATSTVASSASGGSMADASNLLNQGQKIYLTGQIALAGLPELCDALSTGLEWTMLNFPMPWEDDPDTEDTRILLARAVFWSGVILTCLLTLHILFLATLLHKRIRIPHILRFPRLELYFAYWSIPAITTASAALFKREEDQSDNEHKEDIILGSIFLVIFPFTFVGMHVYVLYSFFYAQNPVDYKAIAVIEAADENEEEEEEEEKEKEKESNSGMASGSSPSPRERERDALKGCAMKCKTGWPRFWERFWWTPLLGPPYDGEWRAPSGPSSMFLPRFGTMFDEYRGKPMDQTSGTFQHEKVGNVTKVDRGGITETKLPASTFVSKWESSNFGHYIQTSGKIVDIFKLAFVASVVSGEDDPESQVQLLVLLFLSLFMLISLRIFRMPIARWDLGMAMLGELSDMITFSIALTLMWAELSYTYTVVITSVMIIMKTVSFIATFMDTLYTALDIVQAVISIIKEKYGPNPKILQVIMDLQKNNPAYLERKYYNRWVLKTLRKGVQMAPIEYGVAPFEEVIYFKLSKRGHRLREEIRQRRKNQTRQSVNEPHGKQLVVFVESGLDAQAFVGPRTSSPREY